MCWDEDTGMGVLGWGDQYEVSTRMKEDQGGGRYGDASALGCRNTGIRPGMEVLGWVC